MEYFKTKNRLTYRDQLLGFYKYFLDKAAISLKSSAHAAYLVHVVLLNFSEEFERTLIRSGYSSVTFLTVQTEKSERIAEKNIGGL